MGGFYKDTCALCRQDKDIAFSFQHPPSFISPFVSLFNPLSLSLFKEGVRVGMTKDIYLSDSVVYICLNTLSVLNNDRENTVLPTELTRTDSQARALGVIVDHRECSRDADNSRVTSDTDDHPPHIYEILIKASYLHNVQCLYKRSI